MRHTPAFSSSAALLIAAFAIMSPAAAQVPQDGIDAPQQAPRLTYDPLAMGKAAAARGDSAEALSQYLRVLAGQPNDVAALAGAGRAALDVGDINAATGFFGRAEDLAPSNGAVKAGLAVATVQAGNARAALRYFRQAMALGVPEASVASDLGFAYDLNGESRRAQAEYQVALRADPQNAGVLRRLALSQAISGDLATSLATLDPLLRRQDVAAWRERAFAKALTGDLPGAEQDMALILPATQVSALRPYLGRLAGLRAQDKAAAVFLGRFPQAGGATVARAAPPPERLPIIRQPLAATVPAASPPTATATTTVSARPATPAAPRTTVAAAPPLFRVSPSLPAGSALAPLWALGARAGSASQAPLTPATLDDSPALRAHERAVAAAQARAGTKKRADPLATAEPSAETKAPADTKAAKAAKAARAEAAAKAKEAQAERVAALAEAKAAKANPARHWVQVAGGANKADLPRAWEQLKAKYPAQLAGRTPSTTHYRFTNRLLIGPFKTSDAAQDWVTDARKKGFGTFRVETEAGDVVEKL